MCCADNTREGRLLTSFLYSPLMSFMVACGCERVSDVVYEACEASMAGILIEIQKLFVRSKSVGRWGYLN